MNLESKHSFFCEPRYNSINKQFKNITKNLKLCKCSIFNVFIFVQKLTIFNVQFFVIVFSIKELDPFHCLLKNRLNIIFIFSTNKICPNKQIKSKKSIIGFSRCLKFETY
ncbi:unnamed protein product [Paramecium octaurelia]|uniref:Uncharacterized protein n=1 Tax=Paramecium octaurelia TaxID=43137 RepID=A0A8S1W0L9_PAROT|nr:unnamed protein product [Paramecium octaurelia]